VLLSDITFPYRWRVVVLLLGVGILNYVDRQVVYSLLPLLRTDLHMSDLALGLTGSAFLWTYGLLSPLAGYLADRFGRARVISFSLLAWTVVTWATSYARTGTELLLLRALMGISEAFYVPAAVALIADLHSDRSRSSATAIHQSGLYVGVVLGGIWGGWLGDNYGWRPAFAILGTVGVIYWLLAFAVLRDRASTTTITQTANPVSAAAELFALSRFRYLFCVFGLYSIVPWTFYTWMPLYLYERLGLSLAGAGFYATVWVQAASILGTLSAGVLADRLAGGTSRARLLVQAAGLMLAGPALALGVISQGTILLIAGLLCFGFGRAAYEGNVMPSLCPIVRPELRSTAMGFLNLAGCLAGGIMTAIAGGVKQTLGLTAVFQLLGVLMVALSIGLGLVRVARTSDAAEELAAR
jgi:MFS transporter, Spinster family, sphingosine-1-phosphate transporter